MRSRSALVLLFLLLPLAAIAYADPIGVPVPDADPGSFAAWLLEHARQGQWSVVTGGVLTVLSLLLRLSLSRLHAWFRSRAGGVVVALAVSYTSILGVALGAGKTPSLTLVLTSLGAAATAAGVWTWIGDLFPALKAATKARP